MAYLRINQGDTHKYIPAANSDSTAVIDTLQFAVCITDDNFTGNNKKANDYDTQNTTWELLQSDKKTVFVSDKCYLDNTALLHVSSSFDVSGYIDKTCLIYVHAHNDDLDAYLNVFICHEPDLSNIPPHTDEITDLKNQISTLQAAVEQLTKDALS